MRFYELMVIVDSDLEVPEGQDAPSLAKAIESIESEGGRIAVSYTHLTLPTKA